MWRRKVSSESTSPPGNQRLPRISVVTPSFNQGKFIERTIRSVLLQNYPSLEYIIIDGGSTDNTVEIIRRYEQYLAFWVSEPDRGQSHAINKGFSIATGQVLCWLNSDDFYLPDTLSRVGQMLGDGSNIYAIAGHCLKVYEDGSSPVLLEGQYQNRHRLLEFWKGYQMHQPAIFWRREVFEKVGLLNEDLHLIMDFDYWARIAEHFDITSVNQTLACCCYHAEAKTGDDYVAYHRDLNRHRYNYWGSILSPQFWLLYASRLRYRANASVQRWKRSVKSQLKSA
ncbi:MAG: glycosyltransferase family 2 protein [Acidobacteriota bacterium]